MKKIQKILVANRGEIALRIMKTIRKMGIQCVAVFSDADKDALHVKFAEESYCLGEGPSAQSYLKGDLIIEICKKHQVDAIHPGYGFLAENADFCRKVLDAGIIFIGPSPEAMEKMGSKIAAKNAVTKFNVPLVPGVDYAIKDVEEGKKIADSIGYPVLIKASAGGGGKGMRTVHSTEDFATEMQMATGEAIAAFGDGAVFVEKLVLNPRHIEIQVLADSHGNCVYLFERECSVQRRHQKVVEEAPSSCLSPELRKKMGEAAVNVCRAAEYENAGTVEFLVDNEMNFYFLEMNTRLQVEHPVTEFITGIDLVEEQIKVAGGEKLSFRQEDLTINGHAIEVRVCAEDPANNFLPDIGKLSLYKEPDQVWSRVDSGYRKGMEIPIYYDPMIAKLIVHADNRAMAIERMKQAIDSFEIVGVETTLDFCRFVMEHPAYTSGQFDTGFVGKYFTPDVLNRSLTEDEQQALALLAAHIYNTKLKGDVLPEYKSDTSPEFSQWRNERSMR